MRLLPALLVLGLLLVSPTAASADATGCTATLQAQVEAWNKGDLATFMQGYLDSPRMTFTGGGEIVQGYQALEERYRSRYGNDTASMGKLRFTDLDVQPLGADHALVVGRWHLEGANAKSFDGVFSLVMQRVAGSWKILHDHSSTRTPKPQTSPPQPSPPPQ